MKNLEIMSLVIGGRKFSAVMSADGPYISHKDSSGFLEGVAIGNITEILLGESKSGGRKFDPPVPAICKYDPRQVRISLEGMSPEDIDLLSRSFAIPNRLNGRIDKGNFFDLYAGSPLFTALCEWVARHPRLAKAYASCGSYIPGWYEDCREANAATNAPATMSA